MTGNDKDILLPVVSYVRQRRSELISQGILEAKRNLVLGKRTITLFYAADFADQLENKIIPSLDQLENKIVPGLRFGYIVLADRYVYTLMARDAVRGISTTWSYNLFGFAMKPHLVFYLDVSLMSLYIEYSKKTHH